MSKEKERKALIHKFYYVYRKLQEKHSLRYQMHFDLKENNIIEIWEYKGRRKWRCICKINETEEIVCYKKAIEMLEFYNVKD